MKNRIILPFLAFATIMFASCNKKEIAVKEIPVITALPVTNLTGITGTGGGQITSDGNDAVTDKGVCWGTNPTPTISDNKKSSGPGAGAFTCNLSGLKAGNTYYLRAYATNSVGTAYSDQINFTTLLADYDGNIYTSVTIGTQVWMVENLKVTHYSNGEAIQSITDATAWSNSTSGAFCWYKNDEVFKPTYGALYNYYAVANSRNLAPPGWHIPSESEWEILANYLGNTDIAGGKLKELGNTHWFVPNYGATNEVGFTALPGGYRQSGGSCYVLGSYGYFWTTSLSNGLPRYVGLDNYTSTMSLYLGIEKTSGFSVRCIKD